MKWILLTLLIVLLIKVLSGMVPISTDVCRFKENGDITCSYGYEYKASTSKMEFGK